MLELLSNIKDGLRAEEVGLLQSEVSDQSIKLVCETNGRKDIQLTVIIEPEGSGYKVTTVTPMGDREEFSVSSESEIVPIILSSVTPAKDINEVGAEEVIDPDKGVGEDELTLEVLDGVYDTKVVPHGSYNNSRYAYSDNYHKMGIITNIRKL